MTPSLCSQWTQISIKNITLIGPQSAPDVTDVSRDGGHSVLINDKILWLYDDTECMGYDGKQLSFVSNTASYADPNKNISIVHDFGVVMVGKDVYGREQYAILADTTVGDGGWVPFQPDELQFNKERKGKERVAIWPGTAPTPISTTQAFIYSPLVYVDYKPQDPSKEYQGRGMTLVTITAPDSGPVATRYGDLIIPGTQIQYGGFASVLGFLSTDSKDTNHTKRDVYLFGAAENGLQVARVNLDDVPTYTQYSFWEPENLNFSSNPVAPKETDIRKIYLPGTFTSGSIFYSPFFHTYIMVYFNRMVDSTFYIRFLNLNDPLDTDSIWVAGGKNGNGIVAEDAEALVKYAWAPEQTLYISPPGKGGFNYAGAAHPEYFNRQYFAQSLYPDNTPTSRRRNQWYGSTIVPEASSGGDGRHLLLSWTSQKQSGYMDDGIYELWLASVEFEDPPPAQAAENKTEARGTSTAGPSSTQAPIETVPPSSTSVTSSSIVNHGERGKLAWLETVWKLGLLLGGVIVGAAMLA